jgi:hypothetical protein
MNEMSRSNRQAAALVRAVLASLKSVEQAARTRKQPVLRRLRKTIEREEARLKNCRHTNDRAVWLALRRIANAVLDAMREIDA